MLELQYIEGGWQPVWLTLKKAINFDYGLMRTVCYFCLLYDQMEGFCLFYLSIMTENLTRK